MQNFFNVNPIRLSKWKQMGFFFLILLIVLGQTQASFCGEDLNGPELGPIQVNKADNPTRYSITEIERTADGQSGDSPHTGEYIETWGIVTAAVEGTGFFLQDGPGKWNGVWVYDKAGANAIGDSVTISGVVAEYYNLTEILDVDKIIVHATGCNVPEPVEAPTDSLNSEAYESVLVKTTGVCDNPDIGYGEWSVNDGTGAVIVDDRFYAYSPTKGVKYSVTGPLNYSYGAFMILPRFAEDVAEVYELTILHNNDGESDLINAGSGLEDFGGVARFKTLVDTLKAQANGKAIMLSSGDNFLAGPEFNTSLKLPDGEPYYDAVAMDHIGYNAVCIGNHDFDFGPDVLARFINSYSVTQPPYLSCNLDFNAENSLQVLVDSGRLAKKTIIEVNGEKVGVIGATTAALSYISSPRNVVVDSAIAAAVQAQVDALENDGINKIILISHLQSIKEDSVLATRLHGIDIMIAGGGDELLANSGDLLLPGDETNVYGSYPLTTTDMEGNTVYIVTGVGGYRYVGRFSIDFDSEGKVSAINPESGPVRVAAETYDDGVVANATLQAEVVDPLVAALDELASNIIATSEVDLDGVKSHVRTQETNEGDLIADALLWQAKQLAPSFGLDMPQVALQNGGGIRNASVLEAGDITELNTFEFLPFANFLAMVPAVPAAQFKEILENAVSRVEFTDGRFAQVAGFSMVYNPNAQAQELDYDKGTVTTPGKRVLALTLDNGTKIVENGEIVEGAPAINVATIDFLAKGGDQYPYNGAAFTTMGVTYQRALYNYIVDGLSGQITADQYPEGGAGRISKGSLGFNLTILHNNDGESDLINAGSGLEDFGGVARFKTLVDTLKAQADGNAIMLSSGDNFLAGPEFNTSLKLPADKPYYDAVAMDHIGYDAVCIGNHDFDFGPDVLARFINSYSITQPPYLSCNLDFSAEDSLQMLVDSGRLAKKTVIEVDGEKVGIIGATTAALSYISSPRNVVVDSAIAAAVQAQVDSLENDGINKIILISHLQSIKEDSVLATRLHGIDIMIAGGGDELLANSGDLLLPGDETNVYGSYPLTTTDMEGNTVYIVTGVGGYRYVGRLSVEFDADGKVSIINPESGPVRVAAETYDDGVVANATLQAEVVDPLVAALDELASNIIATSEVDLDGVKSHVRTQETNEGDLIADALLWQAKQLAPSFGLDMPQVALQNGGGIRNNSVVESGDFTELNTFEFLPFANFLAMVPAVPAAQFKEILENAVSRVEFTDGRFAQIAGFHMAYNPNGQAQELDYDKGTVTTPGKRIIEVILNDGTVIVENGELVEGAPAINVATIDFLAKGGDQYPYNGAAFTTMGVTYQRALYNYIVEGLSGKITAAQYPEGGSCRICTAQMGLSLTILHNNDGESDLINAGSGLEDFGGVARFKTLVDTLKAQAEGKAIMLSSGDNFLAGSEFTASLNLPADQPYYDAVAMDYIGYDAVCIGNHDFDFGPDVLARFINSYSMTQPPYLSCNLDFSAEDSLNMLVKSGRLAKRTILEVDGQKVGIVGATTGALSYISSPRNVKVDTAIAAAVQAQVDSLEADGVNKIILISHLQSIKEDSALATRLSGVDVMIAGGGDELLANDGALLLPGDEANIYGSYPMVVKNANEDNVYIITSVGGYRYVGRLNIEFDADGKVTMVDPSSGPVRVAAESQEGGVVANADVQTKVVDPIQKSLEALASNIIAKSEVILNGVKSNVRTKETNEGNLIADALLWQAQELAADFGMPTPTVGLQNGGGIRNNSEIPAGDITELNTFDMVPFANFVSIVPGIPAAQFKEILENAVSNVENVDGRFAQISGFSMIYAPEATAQELDLNDGSVLTAGKRVLDVTLDNGTKIVENGEVVKNAPAVNVATIDFLAKGGDQYPYRDAAFTTLGITYQRAVYNYIVESLNGKITAKDYPEGGEGRTKHGKTGVASDQNAGIPKDFVLNQNYPNPFNPVTNIRYGLPKNSDVKITLYNVRGQVVATIFDGAQKAGWHTIQFAANDLASGLYFYKIEAASFRQVKKMILMK